MAVPLEGWIYLMKMLLQTQHQFLHLIHHSQLKKIQNSVTAITVTDADNDSISFSLSGTDADSFAIASSGARHLIIHLIMRLKNLIH